MTRGVVLLVATFRLLVLLAFIRQLKSGCCRVRYIPLDRVLRVSPPCNADVVRMISA